MQGAHIVLDRGSNAPRAAAHSRMVRGIKRLNPKPEFDVVDQRLIHPRYFLISVEQAEHVMARNLASGVCAHVTSRAATTHSECQLLQHCECRM